MKSGVLKFSSLRERRRVAQAIRDERDRRGLTAADLRVIAKGTFEIEVEATDPVVFDAFFQTVQR